MGFKKRPPSGYSIADYPLPHEWSSGFELTADSDTGNSTIINIFRQSQEANAVETIKVNPRNGAFAEETGVTCAEGSIIGDNMFRMAMHLTKGAIETDKLRELAVYIMPIYMAFDDTYTAMDTNSSTEIEDVIEMARSTSLFRGQPLYDGNKLTLGGTSPAQPLNTIHYAEAFGDWGLTTTAVLESVAFSENDFYDTINYKTNGGMLKKVTGRMMRITLKQDRPFYKAWTSPPFPSVKRMNPFTYCGMLVHVPPAGAIGQFSHGTDVTAINHVRVTNHGKFDEWNQNFEQVAV